MEAERTAHPCFDRTAAGTVARVHLPVAPKCNIQCAYCNRKFDCPNEGRPGVSSAVLSPAQAAIYLDRVAERVPVGVVGIAGPGDALAQPDATFETLRLAKERLPDAHLCLSTNGLVVNEYLDDLAAVGVTHVTVTVNAMDPEVGSLLYRWARSRNRNYRGRDAAELLIERQRAALHGLASRGITVKVNTILIPGVNESQIEPIARCAAGAGCEIMNVIPVIPVAGTAFEGIAEPSPAQVAEARRRAAPYIRQSTHCARCRADAVGLLGARENEELRELLVQASRASTAFTTGRGRIAFVSREGMFVNQHLGEAREFYVCELTGDRVITVFRRDAPEKGCGDERWTRISEILADCAYLLVSAAGTRPIEVLGSSGLTVVEIEGVAQDAAYKLFTSQSIAHLRTRKSTSGAGCGRGTGCG
ncbi:MAG: radical SAM protein [Spirochaetota bacterium]